MRSRSAYRPLPGLRRGARGARRGDGPGRPGGVHVRRGGIGCGSTPRRMKTDRKSVVSGKSVSVRVDLGGRRLITKKTKTYTACYCSKISSDDNVHKYSHI